MKHVSIVSLLLTISMLDAAAPSPAGESADHRVIDSLYAEPPLQVGFPPSEDGFAHGLNIICAADIDAAYDYHSLKELIVTYRLPPEAMSRRIESIIYAHNVRSNFDKRIISDCVTLTDDSRIDVRFSLLAQACTTGHFIMVEQLLAAGADPRKIHAVVTYRPSGYREFNAFQWCAYLSGYHRTPEDVAALKALFNKWAAEHPE